jgi:hypothetical protein
MHSICINPQGDNVSEKNTSTANTDRQHHKAFWCWCLLVDYAACIFALSAIPGQALPRVRVNDKLVHALEFGMLAVLTCRALRIQAPSWPLPLVASISILVAICYGAVDEAHQLFVSQRTAELADVAADSLGATLAAWSWLKVGTRWTHLQ